MGCTVDQSDPVSGFGQIESQVIDVGMIGEATCIAKPGQIIPMVVVGVQPVVASGQVSGSGRAEPSSWW